MSLEKKGYNFLNKIYYKSYNKIRDKKQDILNKI